MYTVRIIPCLDVKDGRVVKGIKFKNLQDAGDPVELAKWYSQEGADEIVFLDITATIEKRSTIYDVVRRTSQEVFVPLTVGGGVRSLEDIRKLLNSGADKVAINTSAVKNPMLVKEAAKLFGSQCIVIAIDAKKMVGKQQRALLSKVGSRTNKKLYLDGKEDMSWEVYINAGKVPTGLDVVRWAKEVQSLGAGEILLTSIDTDGTKEGYDIPLIKKVVENVSIPVIASGGAGKLEHLVDVILSTNVSAVLAASIFHYKKYSIKKVKGGLNKKGIPVRL